MMHQIQLLLFCVAVKHGVGEDVYLSTGETFTMSVRQPPAAATLPTLEFTTAAGTVRVYGPGDDPDGITARGGRLTVSRSFGSQCITYNLRVTNVQSTDFGTYSWTTISKDCGGNKTNRLIETVLVDQPTISCRLVDTKAGHCDCTSEPGKPPASVSWTVTRGGTASGSRLSWSTVDANALNGKDVTCRAQQTFASRANRVVEKTHTLRVWTCPTSAPTLSTTQTSLQLVRGDVLRLSCTAPAADPPPTLSWWLQVTGGQSTQVQQGADLSHTVSGNGSYYCRAMSPLAECSDATRSTSVQVDALYGPTTVTVTGSKKVAEGRDLQLTCSADCNPTCSYSWRQLPENRVVGNGPSYTQRNISRAFHGKQIQCTASSELKPSPGHGSSRSVSQRSVAESISVWYGPDPNTGSITPSSSTSLNTLSNGTYQLLARVNFAAGSLTCSADCRPAASCSYHWKLNGAAVQPPDETLTLGTVAAAGFREYHCVGKNSNIGSASEETVHRLLLFVHSAATSLSDTDVTARSVALGWVPGYSGGFSITQQVDKKDNTSATWRTVNVLVKSVNQSYNSARVTGLEPQTTYEFRIRSLLKNDQQSLATSTSISKTTEALPSVQQEDVSVTENSVTFTWQHRGGNVRQAVLCAQRYAKDSDCFQNETKSFGQGRRRKQATNNRSISMNLSNAQNYWYSLLLYDGLDLLFRSKSFDGGAGSTTAPPESIAAIAGGSAGAALLVIGLVVGLSIFLVRRKKAPNTKTSEPAEVGIPEYSEIPQPRKSNKGKQSKSASDENGLPIYSEVKKPNKSKKEKKDKTSDLLEATGDEGSSAAGAESAFPVYSEVKKKGGLFKGKKGEKNKKGTSDKAATDKGAEFQTYANTTEIPVYSNVAKPVIENEYSNINPHPSKANMIVDQAKDHPDWKENKDGLLYADIGASRPVQPEGQPEPIHQNQDNCTYADLDFQATAARAAPLAAGRSTENVANVASVRPTKPRPAKPT